MGRLIKGFQRWTGEHALALDVAFIGFLILTLMGNLHSYTDGVWGPLVGGMIFGAILARTFALGWGRGYIKASREARETIALQQALIEMQKEALSRVVTLPVVEIDTPHRTIHIRMGINPN